jgi:hypothetical protein
MDQTIENAAQIIESFAEACERMNSFARALRAQGWFGVIRTGADIRKYESGWRLEKFIEAELNSEKGEWACWWLEIGLRKGQWLISSNISITNSEIHLEFEDRQAGSNEELKICLNSAVSDLEDSLNYESDFKRAVEAAKKKMI